MTIENTVKFKSIIIERLQKHIQFIINRREIDMNLEIPSFINTEKQYIEYIYHDKDMEVLQ